MKYGLIAFFALCCCSMANAGAFLDSVNANRLPDTGNSTLEDNSREAFIDGQSGPNSLITGAGYVSPGDQLYGYFKIDSPTNNLIYGVFSQTVTTATPLNNFSNLTATGNLAALTGDAISSNAMFAVYEINSGLVPDLINGNPPAYASIDTIQEGITAIATQGTLLFTGGVDLSKGNYVAFQLNNPLDALTTEANLSNRGSAFASVSGNLSIIDNYTGATFNNVQPDNLAQLSFIGSIGGRNNDPGTRARPTDEAFSDTAKFTLNVTVPEPASIAAWSLMGLVLGAGAMLRRRSSK